MRYIEETLEGTIDLRRKKNDVIVQMLEDKNYFKINEDFKYLIKMPMDSVNEENVEKMKKECYTKNMELDKTRNTTINEMWINELDNLRDEYIQFRNSRCESNTINKKKEKKEKKNKTPAKTPAKKV